MGNADKVSHPPHLSQNWRDRVASKVGTSAVAGAACGAFLATMKKENIVKVAPAVGLNFAIFTGCFATTQELLRSISGRDSCINSVISGGITGGFFSGLHGGSQRIIPGVIIFGSGLGMLHYLDDCFQFGNMYKLTMNSMDLLDLDEKELRDLQKSQAWDWGKYWPSFMPPPIRFLSPEEVEEQKQKRRMRIKQLHDGQMIDVDHALNVEEEEQQYLSAQEDVDSKPRNKWWRGS